MKTINTIIVDDEPDSVKMLQLELAANCPEVEVLATFTRPVNAIPEIEKLKPDLLFLDIEMPGMNGFQLLEKIMYLQPGVVFVTAYNQYALKAFKFNALDYLVKPVDVEELKAVVKKAASQLKPSAQQLEMLQQQLRGTTPTKLAIPGPTGAIFINLDEIIFVESDNNYSKMMLTEKRQYVLSKTLKEVQDILEDSHFLRIHRQYIVNLNHVRQMHKNDGTLTLDTGEHLPIARNQKEVFNEKYKWL